MWIVYLFNYQSYECLCLNAPRRLETPCLSLNEAITYTYVRGTVHSTIG